MTLWLYIEHRRHRPKCGRSCKNNTSTPDHHSSQRRFQIELFVRSLCQFIFDVMRHRSTENSTFCSSGLFIIADIMRHYTVSGKKGGHVICNYNSCISWSIFIIFVPLKTRMNSLQLCVIYLLKCLMTS